MSETIAEPGLSTHRSEALTDGIYAVAMTLLVIELKLPDHGAIQSADDLANALVALLPKLFAWIISFGVLALFWMSHHRLFNQVRRTDRRLVVYNLAQLGFVSLMPFSCAVLGEHAGVLSQAVYSFNMAMLAATGLLIARHIHRHPELSGTPMSRGVYNGVRIRIGGLVAISAVAIVVQALLPEVGNGIGNIAFMLMAVISPLSRRVERAAAPAPLQPAAP